MTTVDYPNRANDRESVADYSHRLARCIASDLLLGGHIADADRAEIIEVIAGQIFARLAIGDEPPRRGSL
jgi:hypothetical protein